MVTTDHNCDIVLISGSKNPGLVNVTIMSKDESWIGGETKFLYVDRFTREELLLQLVKDSEMQRKMFECMYKGISSDLQTSDPSGKALPGRFIYSF